MGHITRLMGIFPIMRVLILLSVDGVAPASCYFVLTIEIVENV
jgi:hypothetical protein